MNDSLSNLIESLREELKQYGEMLALLDHQQNLVMRRQSSDLIQSVTDVNTQVEVIHAVRREREQHRSHLARQLNLNPDADFNALMPLLAVEYRGLIKALVQENNELLVRVKQRARQNHLMLTRATELMQRFINALSPAPTTSTYNVAGVVAGAGVPQHAMLEVIV